MLERNTENIGISLQSIFRKIDDFIPLGSQKTPGVHFKVKRGRKSHHDIYDNIIRLYPGLSNPPSTKPPHKTYDLNINNYAIWKYGDITTVSRPWGSALHFNDTSQRASGEFLHHHSYFGVV